MPSNFYPFVDATGETGVEKRASEDPSGETGVGTVRYPARIAVYDDPLSTPRVVVVEAKDVRSYLEEVTDTVSRLAKEQGSGIPFMVIREIVENFIHASFIEPTVSILDDGNTIRFADQGPGIQNKELALEPGTTSASAEMKRYIRGVGSGFPTVQQYLDVAGGSLSIEDNMGGGTVVTVTIDPRRVESAQGAAGAQAEAARQPYPQQPVPWSAQQPSPAPWAGAAPGYYPYPMAGYGFPPTYPQGVPMGGTPFQPAASTQPPYAQTGGSPSVDLSERGSLAVSFMQANGPCGPTDLARACGASTATWSRELAKLENVGLVRKSGQKYQLTELGTTWQAV